MKGGEDDGSYFNHASLGSGPASLDGDIPLVDNLEGTVFASRSVLSRPSGRVGRVFCLVEGFVWGSGGLEKRAVFDRVLVDVVGGRIGLRIL